MAGAPAGYDVFLSYSRADQAAADALRDRLVDQPHKLRVFIDWRALAAGRPWQPALEAALAGCRAMLVLIGPEGIGGWQHREIQLGLDRQTGAEQTPTPFPVMPVLLPGLEPDDYVANLGRLILARRRPNWCSPCSGPSPISSVGRLPWR